MNKDLQKNIMSIKDELHSINKHVLTVGEQNDINIIELALNNFHWSVSEDNK